MRCMEIELNLVRKLAWKHQTANIEYEDLFQEGCRAYLQAKKLFNPEKNVKLTTFCYIVVEQNLIKLTEKCRRKEIESELEDRAWENIPDEKQSSMVERFEFLELLESLSDDALRICQTVLESPHEYLFLTKTEIKTELCAELAVKNGWTQSRVKTALQSVYYFLNGRQKCPSSSS